MSKEKMSTPICDFLRDYAASGISRFHMPGHKGMDLQMSADGESSLSYSHDITEISGADSLYEANGIIRESEENASRLFGTAATFYSTEGSSQCIRAMLALATDFGKNPVILAARNVHRAFITAAALLDLDVHWLMPEEGFYSLCACPVTAKQIRSSLSGMDVLPAAVYITSPDYLGNCLDLRPLAEVCHRRGIPLLVDNAHGAYLKFLPEDRHPLTLGADACCDSAHKTLSCLTGAAYLHLSFRAPAGWAEQAEQAMSLFASTSPSWLILQSLDQMNAELAGDYPARLCRAAERLAEMKQNLRREGWTTVGDEPLKLALKASCRGYTGGSLQETLRRKGIECEFADREYLVLMPSAETSEAEWARLAAALREIPRQAPLTETPPALPAAERVCSVRRAMLSPQELLSVDRAVGRVLADACVSCPPAVPVVTAGERITEEAAECMRYYGISECRVMKGA